MIEKSIVVTEKNGLHARPASSLVKCASRFKCDVSIKSMKRLQMRKV